MLPASFALRHGGSPAPRNRTVAETYPLRDQFPRRRRCRARDGHIATLFGRPAGPLRHVAGIAGRRTLGLCPAGLDAGASTGFGLQPDTKRAAAARARPRDPAIPGAELFPPRHPPATPPPSAPR